MPAGALEITSPFLSELLRGQLSSLTSGDISAILLEGDFAYNPLVDTFYAEIQGNEISGGDYAPATVTGAALTEIANGARFTTDDVSFGNPVDIPYCRYMAILVGGIPLQPGARLIGVVDLATDAVLIRSINGEFTVNTPASGWYEVTRS